MGKRARYGAERDKPNEQIEPVSNVSMVDFYRPNSDALLSPAACHSDVYCISYTDACANSDAYSNVHIIKQAKAKRF